jgi:probable F420-dependent oxidoreductase
VKLGLYLRNMGPVATRENIVAGARAAEAAGLDDIWVTDHIAIPPDDAEGSEGRYLDPLATLAFLAGVTERISLGVGVLVLPYRPPLPTAKWVATVQELAEGRLLLGVGVGWMAAEFKAVGVDRKQRGRICDETLDFLVRCFASDEVEAGGQRFLFRPRPPRPPLFVGGAHPYATRRAARVGAGWVPMGGDPDVLAASIAAFRSMSAAAGTTDPEVALVTSLDMSRPDEAGDAAARLRDAGVTRLIHGFRYDAVDELARVAEVLAGPVRAALD